MSIPDFFNKIKGFDLIDRKTLIYLVVVSGVGMTSFGLGRLSVDSAIKTDDKIIISDASQLDDNRSQSSKSKQVPTSLSTEKEQQMKFVASKNGKLYYNKGCRASNRIKPENEVWFESESDAQASGYTPSSSCK